MDLFFLRAYLRRQLLSTNKFEDAMEQLRVDAERYRKVEKMPKVTEFLTLEKEVTSSAFQAQKKRIAKAKYADSDEAKKLAQYKTLERDKYVKAYLKKGTEEGRGSVQRYLELGKEIETADFQKRLEFWRNKNRWATTPEGEREAQYTDLLKDEDIIFYQKADLKQIEQFEQFQLVYSDDFYWTRLDASDWKAGAVYPSKDFKAVHSYQNEKQAYTGGKNVETSDSILYIKTKKEPTQAAAWDEKKGFVTKEFAYSSDMISNEKVAIEEGAIVQVKVRCRGHLNHGIYLRSAKHVPFISLFNYVGLKLFVGIKDQLKGVENMKCLDGLQPVEYVIYTVSWQKDEIVWLVNNLEVFRTKNLIPKGEKLYMHLYSYIMEKVNTRYATEGDLEVDWVKVYKRK